jgi:hypothetical protein
LEHRSDADNAARHLIDKYRRLVSSPDFAVRFRTLWTIPPLSESLFYCTDHEIADLMLIVQERFYIFQPEFGICYHARKRLLLKP